MSILESIKLLKDWSIWLVGIQTAAIAAIVGLLKTVTNPGSSLMVWCGTGAILFFVISISFATFLLVALPAFYMRFPDVEKGKDFVYLQALELDGIFKNWKPTILFLIGGEQYAFLVGIVFFGVFAASRLWGG